MFFKINPRVAQMFADLGAEGFLLGDRLWVRLVGDFQISTEGSGAVDEWQNTNFQIGTKTFYAPSEVPKTVKATDTTLVINNLDRPLADNSDPDHDYGVRVKLAAFTSGDDVFRFAGRSALPEVQGSIYRAGAGDDVVVMPDTPVAGFHTDRLFRAGAGNDKIIAGDLDLKVDFGLENDTFVLNTAIIDWAGLENRDRDATIVVKSDDSKYELTNAEIIKSGSKEDLLVKWYFDLARGEDGSLQLKFFENGKLIASGGGFYDEALPAPKGVYEATFLKGGWMGSRIELSDVSGFGDVLVHKGASAAATEADFVVGKGFLNEVFAHIEDAYNLAGQAAPWRKGVLDPLVPVTAAVRGDVDQPVLKVKNLVTNDAGNNTVAPKFTLQTGGDTLDDKSVEIFFKVGGKATLNVDWSFAEGTRLYNGDDFADGVLRQGRDASGAMIYSVMLGEGERSVDVPIRIIRDTANEQNEKISFSIVDVDLWRHAGSDEKLYRLSGGPGNDSESDFDGPAGAEQALIHDGYFTVTINDHLV